MICVCTIEEGQKCFTERNKVQAREQSPRGYDNIMKLGDETAPCFVF